MAGWLKLPITGGTTIIDLEDYDKVMGLSPWYVSDAGYALKRTRLKGKNITYRLHRVINNTPHRLVTDHINGDRLDNRKDNLRTVTERLNSWNKTVPRAHLVYKDLPYGITYDKARSKFVARKTISKRFQSLEEAVDFMGEK